MKLLLMNSLLPGAGKRADGCTLPKHEGIYLSMDAKHPPHTASGMSAGREYAHPCNKKKIYLFAKMPIHLSPQCCKLLPP